MSMPEQSGDSFDFCVLFRVYFTGKGAQPLILLFSGADAPMKPGVVAAAGDFQKSA